MAEGLSDAARNVVANAVAGDWHTATVKVYTGSRPSPGAAATGTELGTGTIASSTFGTASAGVATSILAVTITCSAAGKPGWFRVANGTKYYDGSVRASTATDNGEEMVLTPVSGSIAVASGQKIKFVVGAVTITQPAQ